MRSIDGLDVVVEVPEVPENGTIGFFWNGDGFTPGTVVPDWWHNAVDRELTNAITIGGLTPTKDDWTQLGYIVARLLNGVSLLSYLGAPCAHFGTVNETYTFLDSANITTDGNNEVITYDNPVSGSWVVTADSNNITRVTGSFDELFTVIPHATISGSYVVYLQCYVNENTHTIEFKFTSDADYTANHLNKLKLATFDFDTGTNTISNFTKVYHKRPYPQHTKDLVCRESNGNTVTLEAHNRATRPSFRVRAYDPNVIPSADNASVMLELYRSGNDVVLNLPSEAGLTSDLSTGLVKFVVGGDDGYTWLYSTDDVILRNNTVNECEYVKISKDGGEQVDSNLDGEKPYLEVPSIRLSEWVQRERRVTLGLGFSSTWSRAYEYWQSAANGNILYFPACLSYGEKLLGFEVTGSVTGGATDLITCTIESVTSTTGPTPTVTNLTLASAQVFDGTNDSFYTKFVELDSIANYNDLTEYYLKLVTTEINPSLFVITEVRVIYQFNTVR